MSTIIFLIKFSAMCIVLVHIVCVAAHLSRKEWGGHQLHFYGLSAAYAMAAGGVLGVVAGWEPGQTMLLLGAAGWIIFDRRHQWRNNRRAF